MIYFPWETLFTVLFFVGLAGVALGFMRGFLNDSDTPSRGVWVWCIGGGTTISTISALGVLLIRMG